MGWGAFYGCMAGVVLVLTIALPSKAKDHDAVVLAVLLLCTWAASNLLTILGGVKVAAAVYPIMDLAGLALAEVLRWRRQAVWKAVVAVAFLAQLILHCIFWTAETAPYAYVLALNLLFALQLAAVGWCGLHRLLVLFFNWLLVSPRPHDTDLRMMFRRAVRGMLR